MIYDLEYFIAKFEAIPEEKWTTGQFVDTNGCMCAYGHCGENSVTGASPEAKKLSGIVYTFGGEFGSYLATVNDDIYNTIGFGTTPKQRVVNYLKSLRK